MQLTLSGFCLAGLAVVIAAEASHVTAVAGEPVSAQIEEWEPARTWVVVVGVLEWKNPGFVPFSKANRKDQELYEALLRRGVPRQHATVLLDEAATRSAILDAVRDAARKASLHDTLIFYYAGHGVRRGDRSYLASYDAASDLDETCVPVAGLATIVQREFRGRRALFFADCCHSGGLREAAAAVAETKRQAASLTSVAPEGISTGNWTFTETLLDGISGRFTVDRDRDGAVTFQELAEDVRTAMKYFERQRLGFANFGVPPRLHLAKCAEPSPYTTVKRTRSLWGKIRKCFWGLRFAISSPLRCRSQAEPGSRTFQGW